MQFTRGGRRLSAVVEWWFVECKNNFQGNLTKPFSPRAYSTIKIINDMRLNNVQNLLIKPYEQQLVCKRKAFCATAKSHRLLEKSEYTGWQEIRNKRTITEYNLRKGKQFHTKGIQNSNQENFNKAKMDPKLAPTVKLNSGYEMPVLGLGTYQSKGEEAEMAVKHAIDVGYRHIDTAYFYENEAEVGKAIKEKICAGVVKREDIFLVTKLWNIHHEPQRVKGAFLKQLETIGLDYIDLYLMHLPVGYKYVDEETLLPRDQDDKLQLTDVDYLDTYKAMEELVKSGLVRSIGVSNFNSEQLQRILDNCCIKPVTNQVECSPALNQRKLTTFCKERDIILTAYSPLGRPNLTAKTPEFYFSPKTQSLANKYQKTPAQIILRYLVDIGTVPIPKSANQKRIEENLNIFDFKLTANDIEIMDSFNTGDRLVPFNLIKAQNHKYFPFHIEF
uniref:NADP-dependent oxidoreductase domain-containing protein n=1 Tax=Glossina palpalis gambiensis TaxID=67801 RepID=A0A1B0B5J9_9MUSC